ncbi:MAG: hypothetical protein ABIR26_19180 [Ramlibacter sp.]
MTDHAPSTSVPSDGAEAVGSNTVEVLNRECFCVSLDQDALRRALDAEIGQPGLFELVQQRCPYLFAARPIFVSAPHLERMAALVRAIESVVALPAYREAVLSQAPPIARHDPGGALGVFFGYDFHVTANGFGLIEVNTNAGGAMLNAVLARAQRACCPVVNEWMPPPAQADALEADVLAMFRSEWTRSGHARPLRSIAIVDEAPEQQYLYPEFLLFQQLFRRHAMEAVIAGPAEFSVRDGVLWHGELAIDLVYNRLTDFALEAPASAVLREAYLASAVVLTPHPQAHALFADKRNLALLSDGPRLEALGVPQATRDVLLAGVPRTEVVEPVNAERLWRDRRKLFFKPFAGFGGRAAYRGDKLTRRVWDEILSGGYVAQALVLPGGRAISQHEPQQVLKFDLRDYAYDGEVQWVAARVYQGQTTNFRTPGGGFAPVFAGPTDGRAMHCAMVAHETRLFLAGGDGSVQPIDRDRYVALVRGEAAAAEFAGGTFILVDWYLRLSGGRAQAVVNENCSWLMFDAQGVPDLHGGLAIDARAKPTEIQWDQIRSLVFGDAAASCIAS